MAPEGPKRKLRRCVVTGEGAAGPVSRRPADGFGSAAKERHDRLRTVRSLWNRRLSRLELQAVAYFQAQKLEEIARLIREKRDIEERIARLDAFLETWGRGFRDP